MGTFRVAYGPLPVNQGGQWHDAVGVEGAIEPEPEAEAAGDGIATFNTSEIFLDGSVTPIGINDLPLGFQVTALSLSTGWYWSSIPSEFHLGWNVEFDGPLIPFTRQDAGDPPLIAGRVTIECNEPFSAYAVLGITILEIDYNNGNTALPALWLHALDPENVFEGTADEFGTYLFGEYTQWSTQLELTTEEVSEGVINVIIEDGENQLEEPESFIVRDAAGNEYPIDPDIAPGLIEFPWAIDGDEFFVFAILPDGSEVYLGPFDLEGNEPDIDVTGSGQVDTGGAAVVMFQGDPSGLYTFVEGKTNDTLYERIGAEDTEDVQIPEPFFKTPFVP